MTLKLSKIPNRTPIKLTSSFPPEVHEALSDYAKIYEQNYAEKEKVEDLIPFMVAAFLKTDSGFKKARRELTQTKMTTASSINLSSQGDS